MATTIQVSEEFRDYMYQRKDREQSYEEWIQQEVGYNGEE